jgi:hypothetical protein
MRYACAASVHVEALAYLSATLQAAVAAAGALAGA